MAGPGGDDDDFDPLNPDDAAHGWAGKVPEFVRKMAVAGIGALFMTEDGLRALAGQLKLPKELLTFVLSSAEKTKDELGRVVSDEVRRFLQSEKLRDEFLKLLTGMTVEIKAQVRLVPSDDKGGPPTISKLEISELGTKRASRKKKE